MSELENPYLQNRKDWNEIIGKERMNTSMWRMFALLELIPMILCIAGMIYAAQLPDVIPFLFKEDASGGITALGVPSQEIKVDNRMIANQLSLFIITLRQVPISKEIRSNYVKRVKMMSTASLFTNTLAPMLTDKYLSAGAGAISVAISTVMPVGHNTWEIDWVEYKNGVSAGKFKATINYIRDNIKFKDPTVLIWNPLDIIVKDININQVIGS